MSEPSTRVRLRPADFLIGAVVFIPFIYASYLLLVALPASKPIDPATSLYAGNFWLPVLASEIGGEIDWMFGVIYQLTMVVMVGVFAVMIAFLIIYRERAGELRRAIYSHGNNTVEVIWTLTPALILVGLAVLSESRWSDAKKERPSAAKSNVYRITARQFAWDVTYPGKDGKLGTPENPEAAKDDFTIPTLHVEKGKPVLITLTSTDVIHSFFLPEFRVKQDALPGRDVDVWFTPTMTGKFQIACAEFCGNGHTNMKGNMESHDTAKFNEIIAKEIEMAAQFGGAEEEYF